VRQVIGDAAILAVLDPPPPNWQVPAFRVDWQPASGTHANGLLGATLYRTSVTYEADDATPAVKFHLGDHLGSSNVVIRKERDEESGLSYHGARCYPLTCSTTAPSPMC
jgi:hypothetical protein